MTEGRSSHQAVKLNNGKVLVMGGYTKVQGNVNEIIAYSRSSEIFDPLTNTWEPSADLNEARSEFTATLLDNGSVLVTGGFNKNLAVSSAEIYDPATSEWRTIGSLNFKRGLHQAVTMNNGRVLLIGGSSADDKCEIFDPVSETFTIISPMKQSRAFHKAVKLDDGRVLVTGGNSTSSAEIYDPESDRWTEVTPMSIPRYKHSMTVLPDGKVLVTGGYGPLDTAMTYPTPILQSSTEIYDPETNSWQVSSPLKNARRSHTVTLLNSNQLLVVGGTQPQDDLSAELSTILDQ
jgi:N-acetylneuraminic acid mutarotase